MHRKSAIIHYRGSTNKEVTRTGNLTTLERSAALCQKLGRHLWLRLCFVEVRFHIVEHGIDVRRVVAREPVFMALFDTVPTILCPLPNGCTGNRMARAARV